MDEFETEPHAVEAPIPLAASYSIIVHHSRDLPSQYDNLIFSKWLRSLRFGNPMFKQCDAVEYYKSYRQYIANLLQKPDCIVRFAVLTDDHDVVLGFAVCREDVLDYLYVQPHARMLGIGKALLPGSVTTFTHITTTAMTIWQRQDAKYKHLKFNPFA